MPETRTKNAPAEEKSAAGPRKDRSPNFPAITFELALENARKLWDADKKHPTTVDLGLKRMGYTKNGRSLRVLAALKSYGVLVAENNDVRVSDDAHAIFLFPVGSPERELRIKALAMRPPIFREVLRRFPGGLPSDETLHAKLQHDMGFTAEAVVPFVKALRAAMAVAGVDHLDESADTGADTVPHEAATMQPSTTSATTSPRPPIIPAAPLPRGVAGAQERHAWKLGNGVWAEVTITGTLTAKRLEKLKGFVALLDAEEEDEADDQQTEAETT